MKLIIQVLTNGLAIFLASYLVPGFIFEGDLLTLLITGLVLGLINFFIKPILIILSAPLIALTLGLFIIIINMALLWLLDYLIPDLTIEGIWAYFWGVVIISVVNIFLAHKKKKRI